MYLINWLCYKAKFSFHIIVRAFFVSNKFYKPFVVIYVLLSSCHSLPCVSRYLTHVNSPVRKGCGGLLEITRKFMQSRFSKKVLPPFRTISRGGDTAQ